MERIEKLQKLAQDWKEIRPDYKCFVEDGILNIDEYLKAKPKILFFLKESNAHFVKIAPLPNDLIGYGPNGNSKLFWRYMKGYEYVLNSIWNNKVLNEEELYEYKEAPNNASAYVNLKKRFEEGRSKSDNKDLENYADNDRDLLKKQIELINPNIIYCAGTFKCLQKIYPELERISDRVYLIKNFIVVDFLHLAHRQGYKTFKQLYELLNNDAVRLKIKERND